MSAKQLDMWDAPGPAQDHSYTSILAGDEIESQSGTLRAKVLAFIADRGGFGATDEEVQTGLMMNPSTQRPRRVELARAGRIYANGEKRRTESGRLAGVWCAHERCGTE